MLLVLKGNFQLGAIGDDLPKLNLHVLLHHLRDTQVAQGLGGSLDGSSGGFLPGFGAGSDQFDHFVDALGHCLLLSPDGTAHTLTSCKKYALLTPTYHTTGGNRA